MAGSINKYNLRFLSTPTYIFMHTQITSSNKQLLPLFYFKPLLCDLIDKTRIVIKRLRVHNMSLPSSSSSCCQLTPSTPLLHTLTFLYAKMYNVPTTNSCGSFFIMSQIFIDNTDKKFVKWVSIVCNRFFFLIDIVHNTVGMYVFGNVFLTLL